MKKPYKIIEEKLMLVEEPMAEYNLRQAEENNSLPDELLIDVLRYTAIAREEKRMISHEDVYGMLATKLGWK